MQKYEISQNLVQGIINFLSTLPWNQVNKLINTQKETNQHTIKKEKMI